MRRHHAPFKELDTFFVARSWVGCITNMSGFDCREAQAQAQAQAQAKAVAGSLFKGAVAIGDVQIHMRSLSRTMVIGDV